MAKLGDLVAVIGADTKAFNKALGRTQYDMRKMTANIQRMGQNMSMAFTAPLAAIGTQSFKTFASFEQQMAKVQAVSGATADEFERLESNAKELGASTRFSASEVAGLQTEFAKLGFTADEITKVTGATLALAQASDSDLARAAEVAGSTLRAYGMDASETGRITDVMAASFSSTALDMDSFADAMKYVAPVANSAGISIEETTAMLGSLANAGIKGSAAGTALRRIISELGATGGDVSGAIAGLASKGLNLADAKDEVGRSAQSALLVLSKTGEQTDELTKSFNNAEGSAAKMAAIMDDTAAGGMARMRSAIEAAQISIGEALAPTITAIADGVASFASRLSEMSKGAQKATVIIGGLVAGIGPALIAVSQMIRAFGTMKTVITDGVIPAVKKMGRVIMANPYAAAALALGALAYAMSDYVSFTDPAVSAAEAFNDTMATARIEAAKNSAQVERLASVVQDETQAEEDRLKALKELQKVSPQYFGQLDMEAVKMGELKTAVDAYKDSILKAAQQRVLTASLDELVAKQQELMEELGEGPNMLDKIIAGFSLTGGAGSAMTARLSPEMAAVAKEIEMVTNKLNELNTTDVNAEHKANQIAKIKEELKNTLLAQRTFQKGSEGYITMQKHAELLRHKLEQLTKTPKPTTVEPISTIADEAKRAADTMDRIGTIGLNVAKPSEPGSLLPDTLGGYGTDWAAMGMAQGDEAADAVDTVSSRMENMQKVAQGLSESMGAAFGSVIEGSATGAEAMKQFGKQALRSLIGIARANAVAVFSSPTNPGNIASGGLATPAIIAGGLALVEGLMGAIAFADGGIVSGPTLGLVGEYSGARNNPEVIAPLDKLQSMLDTGGSGGGVLETRIKGSDLVLVMEKGMKDINRRR